MTQKDWKSPGCRLVCRPKRSAPRAFRPADIQRIVANMRVNGVSEEDIRRAVNRAGLFALDDAARPLIEGIRTRGMEPIQEAIGDLDEALRTLDAIFGDTDWTLPRGTIRLLKGIPVIGRWIGALLSTGAAAQRAVQRLKDALTALGDIEEALDAAEKLTDDRR